MAKLAKFAAILCFLGSSVQGQGSEPLSVIEWLSDSVNIDRAETNTSNVPQTATSASSPEVTTLSLDQPSPNSAGLMSAATSGFPLELWMNSQEADLVRNLSTLNQPGLPILRQILTNVLLTQADAPIGSDGQGRLLVARVDMLLRMGKLEEARALLLNIDPMGPEMFRRFFDVSLLLGTEDEACAQIDERPTVAPTYSARIFCLARSGDWSAAALTLNTRRVLGDLSEEDDLLIGLFLDPEAAELDADLPPPQRVTPLIFRMREAVGETLPTSELPLAFAHADLRDTAGWKAQLDAAERLARHEAVDPNVFHALYTSRPASASGGVWDRVDAYQALDAAIMENSSSDLTTELSVVWQHMTEIKAEAMLARLTSSKLQKIKLDESGQAIATSLQLLSSEFEPVTDFAVYDPFLVALAEGRPQEVLATSPERLAVQAAFNGAPGNTILRSLVEQDRLGEALLTSLTIADEGLDGNLGAITEIIAFFRSIGLEDTARQIGLQFLILDTDI